MLGGTEERKVALVKRSGLAFNWSLVGQDTLKGFLKRKGDGLGKALAKGGMPLS